VSAPDIDWSLYEPQEPPPDEILEQPLLSDEALAAMQEEPSEPVDRTFLKQPRRKPHAKKYEDKIRGLMLVGTQIGLSSPNTVADACTVIVHGPKVARTWGDLAAENETVANAIDFITKPSDSPITAAMLASIPMALQLVRNHEPVAETPVRVIRVPFTKREIKLRFKINLGRLQNMTLDPDELTERVLAIPEIKTQIDKWGLKVALRNERKRKGQ
jgi:hypothetical protein